MDLFLGLLFPLLPIATLWLIVRHGPIRSPWWRHETAIGFALLVGAIAFLAGFLGPIILAPDANQGPLLGIFFTGPVGMLVGLVWGMLRAGQRRKSRIDTT